MYEKKDESCNTDACNGNCDQCDQKKDLIEKTNELNNIKKVIPIISGKGGVGKSMTTSMLAAMMRRRGYNVGVLDADVTGPSIPKMFGLDGKATANELGIYPLRTHNDIRIMSVNLLLDDVEAPVVWRGPMIAGAVKQFWTDVIWGDIDFLFVDMPPGTGDVPLTVFQSLPVDGIVVVTSPQDLVAMIVKKAYKMAGMMNVPVLGLIENMSYALCPDCGKRIDLFGASKTENIAKDLETPFFGQVPFDSEIAKLGDEGQIEKFSKDYFNKAADALEKLL